MPTYPLLRPTDTVDNSAYELNLRMTRGDAIVFEFLAENCAAWAGHAWECTIRPDPNSDDVIAEPVVIAEVSGVDMVLRMAHGPTAALTADAFAFDLFDATDGITRFGGTLTVDSKDVTR